MKIVQRSSMARMLHRAVGACAAILALAVLSLAPHLTSSTELVRLRNAVLFDDDRVANFTFDPASPPAGFLVDRGPPDPFFTGIVDRLALAQLPTDWDRAVKISEHLLANSAGRDVDGNQTDLRRSYLAIVERGEGYCADLVRAFVALANAAGLPVRMWAFSFDGFGGHGHVWVEIWNRQASQLQLLDVYNNTYFVGESGVPMSALEFRTTFEQRPDSVRMRRIDPRRPPGYKYPEKAWAYYRRGMPEWYMWWGNNVFSFDRAPLVRHLLPISYTGAQIGAIVEGVFPHIRPLETAQNQSQIASMRRLRTQLRLVSLVCAGAILAMVGCLVALARSRPPATGTAAT